MTFRADVEGLRAVAIAIVVLAHARLGFAAGGYVGVDVFFVISGLPDHPAAGRGARPQRAGVGGALLRAPGQAPDAAGADRDRGGAWSRPGCCSRRSRRTSVADDVVGRRRLRDELAPVGRRRSTTSTPARPPGRSTTCGRSRSRSSSTRSGRGCCSPSAWVSRRGAAGSRSRSIAVGVVRVRRGVRARRRRRRPTTPRSGARGSSGSARCWRAARRARPPASAAAARGRTSAWLGLAAIAVSVAHVRRRDAVPRPRRAGADARRRRRDRGRCAAAAADVAGRRCAVARAACPMRGTSGTGRCWCSPGAGVGGRARARRAAVARAGVAHLPLDRGRRCGTRRCTSGGRGPRSPPGWPARRWRSASGSRCRPASPRRPRWRPPRRSGRRQLGRQRPALGHRAPPAPARRVAPTAAARSHDGCLLDEGVDAARPPCVYGDRRSRDDGRPVRRLARDAVVPGARRRSRGAGTGGSSS